MCKNFLVNVFDTLQICKGSMPIKFGQKYQTCTEHIITINTTSPEHPKCVDYFLQQIKLPFKSCVGYFIQWAVVETLNVLLNMFIDSLE